MPDMKLLQMVPCFLRCFLSRGFLRLYSLLQVSALAFFLLIPSFHEARVIKVGIIQNPPKIFMDKGKATGIYVDILEYIAKKEDWDLEYIQADWDSLLSMLDRADLDLVPDMAYSTERAKRYDFHEIPILFSWSGIYARKGLSMSSIMDLEGRKVAVLLNSIQQTSLASMIRGFGLTTQLIPYHSFDEAFKKTSEGEADAVASNVFYGKMHAGKANLEETTIVFEPSDLYIATTKGYNGDLLKVIDKHITNLKSTPNSAYYSSLKRWTTDKPEVKFPLWMWGVGILLVTLLGVSFIAWMVLKREVKRRTKDLEMINHEMERRIEERTEELALTMQKAQVADMLKSAFLATMSHELRTPLNSIIGFTGIILQELPGKINTEQRKQLQIVQNSSRHLLALINDILDISKIEAEQLELHYGHFDVSQSLKKLANSILPQAEMKGIKIMCECPPLCINADQRRFEQVVLNLISNALKFTEEGSISISCKMEEDFLRVSVIDTGIGIDAKQFDKLFLPFQQIDTGLTRKYDGSGLGLSICQKLVHLMGGEISVQSEVGKGSSFSFTVPYNVEVIDEKNSDH